MDYLENQVEKLHVFAQQNGVGDRIKGVCMDVEKNNGQELVEEYPEHFDLVSVARFLHRYTRHCPPSCFGTIIYFLGPLQS